MGARATVGDGCARGECAERWRDIYEQAIALNDIERGASRRVEGGG